MSGINPNKRFTLGAYYEGVCSTCHCTHSSVIFNFIGEPSKTPKILEEFKVVKVVPPPTLEVACQCQIPVVPLKLFYTGKYLMMQGKMQFE